MSLSKRPILAAGLAGLALLELATPARAANQLLNRRLALQISAPGLFSLNLRAARLASGFQGSAAGINPFLNGRLGRQSLVSLLNARNPFAFSNGRNRFSPFNSFNRSFPFNTLNPFSPLNTANGLSAVSPLSGAGMGGWGGSGSAYGGEDSGAGYLVGSAAIMNAQGQLMLANQQAILKQQEVKRERLSNRRRVLDEWLYERAHTPTLEQLRQEGLALQLDRSRNDPPVTDVLSGQSLNSLLRNLVKLQGEGAKGAPVKLDPDVLKHINVAATPGGATPGLLRQGGKLNWPAGLLQLSPPEEAKAARSRLDGLMAAAVSQAEKGAVDANILKGLATSGDDLRQLLRDNGANLASGLYLDAKRFLNDLDEALRVLRQPDAARFLNGYYAARGETVQELVQNMTNQGLWFAPAVAGDEPAYAALQRALVNYSNRLEATTAER